jgi:hypothetical protein
LTTIGAGSTCGHIVTDVPASTASFCGPVGVFVDTVSGNIFVADQGNSIVREIVGATGKIQTVAGNGTFGFSGDGGPATSAQLNSPSGVFVDVSGNIFIADRDNSRIREVMAGTGNIQTVAGNGTPGFVDNVLATSAEFNVPFGVFVDRSGNIFIADQNNNRIREVVQATGFIQTVAGNGLAGFSGDGGLATSAELLLPQGVFVDRSANIFVADHHNNRIREVVQATGFIQTVAGIGTPGFSGDGGPATSAALNFPAGVFVDGSGNIFVVDNGNLRIREVMATTGIIQTVAGNGKFDLSGDGGPATNAQIDSPFGVSVDGSGNIFIGGSPANIRQFVASTGKIQTVAGNGTSGFSGDGGPATSARLGFPFGVSVDGSGNIFIADQVNNRIREVTQATGIIQTVAGNGTLGRSGDGGPATSAELTFPVGVFVDDFGNIFIADQDNNRIQEVVQATGFIQTVAGNGTLGFSGDGGLATSAELNFPAGVFGDVSGNIFIADTSNSRIREVMAGTGVIQTVAGNGTFGFSGDGGPATSAGLNFPYGVSVSSSGNIFIADTGNSRIREVTAATGIIQTVAGNGTAGFSGDGGDAVSAELNFPKGVALDAFGSLFIADTLSGRVREIPSDFALSLAGGASATATVNASQTATYSLQLTSSGFTGMVSLSCTGAPAQAVCSPSPTSVTLDESTVLAITVTLTTTARSEVMPAQLRFLLVATWFLALLSLAKWGGWRLRPRLIFPAMVLLFGLLGCGGSKTTTTTNVSGTPAGNSALTVTASSGSLSRTVPLTLTVN